MDLSAFTPLIGKIDPSDIIATCAVIISVVSIILVIKEGRDNRNHLELSVKPSLDVDIFHDKSADKISYKLHNHGLGPAYIADFGLYIKGNKVKGSDTDMWDNIIHHFIKTEGMAFTRMCYVITPSSIIASNGLVKLLELSVPNGQVHLEHLFEDLEIRIDYKCAYGKVQSFIWPEHRNPSHIS